jgi:LPS export ABC transporter protein LptC
MFYTMKIARIKQMLLVTIGVMVVTMGIYIYVYINETDNVKPVPIPDVPKADIVVSDFEVSETFHDRVLWELHADVAEVYSDRQETQFKDVEFDFFDEQGNKSMHLISDYGVKDDLTGDITLSGNVQASALHEGTTLKADKLFYNAETGKITSDTHVIIERGNIITEGEGLESDLSLKKARILRDVKTYFTPEE